MNLSTDATELASTELVLPSELPIRPGESPFQTKGSIYIAAKAYHATRVPGGVRGVLDAMEDRVAREFYAQEFLPNGWYDYLPMALVARAAAARAGQPPSQWLFAEAERHAERDVGGIYKVLLRFSSPEAVMKRLPRVTQQYFNFLRVEGEFPEPRTSVQTIHGMPEFVAPLYQFYTSAFVRRLVMLSGGLNLRRVWEPPVAEGNRAGLPLVRLRVRNTWE